MSFPGAIQTERVIDREHASRTQFCWRSKRNLKHGTATSYRSRVAIGGSLWVMDQEFAACGWAVVQMDPDGRMTPWYGVGGIVPTSLEVQRDHQQRAEIWALCMSLCKLCGPSEIPLIIEDWCKLHTRAKWIASLLGIMTRISGCWSEAK